ncbi:MAG: hypothetical protein JSU70_21285 [Phycisphaerales bacterium]|nr:MAG: hypothetical protein JSU70_21285 [Phycisphaerales bacterium]
MDRRDFLLYGGAGIGALALAPTSCGRTESTKRPAGKGRTEPGWLKPSLEFSQAPFWFWNDRLSEAEIVRQLDDFRAHGVHAFVIHARAGLPRDLGWMSEGLIGFMRFAIEEAAKRKMWVVLYDEGMYPSGSSSGQVVAENSAFRTRGLFHIDLDTAEPNTEQHGIRIGDGELILREGQNLVTVVERKTNGHRIAVIDRAIRDGYSVIRGLHFLEDDPPRRPNRREVPENAPPAADILNPEAVQCFIRLVYQRFYDELEEHFGKTVKAIFTDEPSFLAKRAERGAVPGTTGILEHVSSWLGYDFTPHLSELWYDDEPDARRYRTDYNRALQARLEETFYRQIYEWCERHRIALVGHPAAPDDIGHLRHFHIPGQDIVWRYIEPGKSNALEGAQSTQGKCASSAMIHLGRRRNANEYCGAYGHNFTFEEMKWLTGWLVVRGCNMLIPHAFYYSVRGPRIDERPPDVGPNSPWWEQYKPFADACRRLCWLNTDSKHVCGLAILGLNDHLPGRAAKICFQHQRDFNYIEALHLWEDARVRGDGIHIAGMHYHALIAENEPPEKAKDAIEILQKAGRVIRFDGTVTEAQLLQCIDQLVPVDVSVSPKASDLRVRHVVKNRTGYYILFNEGQKSLEVRLETSAKGKRILLDPETGRDEAIEDEAPLLLKPHALRVLMTTQS